jgi:myo-inositol-1(or 4)-monophosphatase
MNSKRTRSQKLHPVLPGADGCSILIMGEHLQFARQLAVDAGSMLLKEFRHPHEVSHKGEVDLVTDMDLKVENLIHDKISKSYPSHSILTEEGSSEDRDSSFRWIVDPLDGTTNYVHGYPVWCVSIALERDGEIELGVIYNPNLDELFHAREGFGAFRNDERINVSEETNLSHAYLATGFPYDIRETEIDNLDHFANFYKRARAVRRAGSAAMDMAYTAAGIFDGFWELKLSPWDTAAGKILVEEAGGTITDCSGGPYEITKKELVCANGVLLLEMLDVLKRGRLVYG